MKPARGRERADLPERFRWNLGDIYPDWPQWDAAFQDLSRQIDAFAALKGTLASGPAALLVSFKASDELGQLAYRVWYFPSLKYDEDQRDNTVNARRQQVQILFARWKEAAAWFNPELLAIPLPTVRGWVDENADLTVYRFAVEDLYRNRLAFLVIGIAQGARMNPGKV